MPITLSYPKNKNLQWKYFSVLRTDAATPKCVLPKGAQVVSIELFQSSNAVTAAGGVDVGWAADPDALVDGAVLGTTGGGLTKVGAAAGVSFAQVLDADREILSTYVVGTSTAGGEGWVAIGYLTPMPNETMFS